MKYLILCVCVALGGCATARDTLLPKTGEILNQAHAAQNSLVEARATLKTVEALVCANPDPVLAPSCLKVEAALDESKVLLNFSADGLDAASAIYTDINEAVKN